MSMASVIMILLLVGLRGGDPIADQFAWVSPFNYAENEPVRHIDLHGLQKELPDGQSGPFSTEFANEQWGV